MPPNEQIVGLRKEVDDAEDLSDRIARKPDATETEFSNSWRNYSKLFDSNVPKIVRLVAQDPASADSFDTLIWITSKKRMLMSLIPADSELEVVGLLGQFHATKSGLARPCAKFGGIWDRHWKHQHVIDFVNAVTEKNPDRIMRGQAALALTRLNRARAHYLDFWENEFDPTDASPQKARAEYFEIAKKGDSKTVRRETERLLEEVMKNYGDCPYIRARASSRPGTTLRDEASHNLYEIRHLMIGEIAPELEGEDLSGKPLKLSDYRGKVVVLSFWASWCGPCMRILPHERELANRMQGKPFALIGVNGDARKVDAQRAIDEEKINWPSFWNGGEGPHGPIPTGWNVKSWPTVFILDAEGRIRSKEGANHKLLDGLVDRLLAESTANLRKDSSLSPSQLGVTL